MCRTHVIIGSVLVWWAHFIWQRWFHFMFCGIYINGIIYKTRQLAHIIPENIRFSQIIININAWDGFYHSTLLERKQKFPNPFQASRLAVKPLESKHVYHHRLNPSISESQSLNRSATRSLNSVIVFSYEIATPVLTPGSEQHSSYILNNTAISSTLQTMYFYFFATLQSNETKTSLVSLSPPYFFCKQIYLFGEVIRDFHFVWVLL